MPIGGAGHLVDACRSARSPDRVAVERRDATAIAARGDRDVLHAVDLVGHRRRADAPAGLELPQLVARAHVVGGQVAVELAGEARPPAVLTPP